MRIGHYRFDCLLTTPASLSACKGSMLRGAFGHAFKKVSCALRRQECQTCLLTETCPYSFVFENHSTTTTAPSEEKVRVAARPHPYAFQPPPETTVSYQPGERFSFGISLFGKANDYLPHIIYAVEMMGENGIGRRHGGTSGQFVLETISSGDHLVYSGQAKVLHRDHPLTNLNLEPDTSPAPETVNSLTVSFLTPLRLKHQNQFQDTLPFHLLIRTALRRLATLEQYYADGEPPLDYRGLTRRAGQVDTLKSDCRWLDLGRYSSRQQAAMFLGGMVGSIQYGGDLGEFLPILRYCQQTQLGKQTTFGLGQILVQAGPSQ